MKETFEEKGKELAKEALQKSMPEAVASVNFKTTDPNGFDMQFTLRASKETALLDRLEDFIGGLMTTGYKPEVKKSFGGRTGASKEYVEGRTCPKCGEKLIYFEAKGKKHIKCSTAKYDWTTKTSSGCDFIEWAQDDGYSSGSSSDRATPAQMTLLKEKNLWTEGMTKSEASEVIGRVLGK